NSTHLSNNECIQLNIYLGIEQKLVTAYRAKGNKHVGRVIQTLKQTLGKISITRPNEWDVLLWRALLAARTYNHRVIETSSAELDYGLLLVTPAVWVLQATNNLAPEEALRYRLKWIKQGAKSYSKKAYQRSIKNKYLDKTRYDKEVRNRELKVNEYVLRLNEHQKWKHENVSIWPYIVENVLENG
ncbi:hypothetical protein BB561_007030, partial [Smittium simulii]